MQVFFIRLGSTGAGAKVDYCPDFREFRALLADQGAEFA